MSFCVLRVFDFFFFYSSRRRHTICALVTGVQTCALPISVVPHDSASDQQWLDRLAQGCARYTPLVALDAPDGLILDIAGAEHLYGGEAGLIVDAEMRLARLGMTLRHALGPTADAARALARYQTRPAPDEEQAIRRPSGAALELETETTTAPVRAG